MVQWWRAIAYAGLVGLLACSNTAILAAGEVVSEADALSPSDAVLADAIPTDAAADSEQLHDSASDALVDASQDAATDAGELGDVAAEASVDVVEPVDTADELDEVAGLADSAADIAPDALADTLLDTALDTAPDSLADTVPDTATDLTADAPADAANDTGEPWFPSWKDKNGCENYEHFEGGYCLAENPTQEKLETVLCWKAGQVNTLGVGKPCMPGSGMCSGLIANCCVMDAKKYGALCSMTCDASTGCGSGAYCHVTYAGGICMPLECKELFDGYYAIYKKKDKGFKCSATGNATGVGTPCKAGGAACLPFANAYCLGDGPFYLPTDQPQLTSFCSIPCEVSADCGAGAECIYSNGKPYFCSPTICSGQFVNMLFGNKPGESAPTSTAEVCVPE